MTFLILMQINIIIHVQIKYNMGSEEKRRVNVEYEILMP